MLKSLYNYLILSKRAKNSQIRTENIPVINNLGSIIASRDCYLSEDYPSGLFRTELLGELYKDEEHIDSGGTHRYHVESDKIELGKRSEVFVLNSLIKTHTEENVVWLSGYSDHPEKGDHWGYDIKIRIDKESDWQYVEVKSFYNGYFYLSKAEYDIAKNNSDKYYLYLVGESGISSLLFAKLLDENYNLNYDNDYFSIETNDFKFTLN